MIRTHLAIAVVALAGSLNVADAQASAGLIQPHNAAMRDQARVLVADEISGMIPQAGSALPRAASGMEAQPRPVLIAMMDDKMGGSPPGRMPMMDDKMGAKPPGGMPMMDGKMGGMPAQGMPAAAGAQAPMERMMSMMGMAMSNMPAMAGRVGMMMPPYEHVEGRIAFLQAELSVTDAQMPQWHAFADAMRSAAKSMQAAVAAQAANTSGSAPARGEREIQFLSARLDAMRTVHTAGTALYAVLSDDQKKIVDDLAAGSMGHM